MKIISLMILMGVLFIGCSTQYIDPQIDMKPPVYVEQLPSKTQQQAVVNPGSIFGQGDNPLFSDLKAMNPNDIVTVVISENIAQSSTGKKTISEASNDSLGAGTITAGDSAGGGINAIANTFNRLGNIGFESGSSNTYAGSGQNSRNETFTTTISARIIKILKNGNYFIEGNRELLVNGEKQIIQISGVIRPYDIDQTNTIDSKYIANARILYKTEGEIGQATSKPWGSRFINSIWPF
ncbi:MAG: flagellar basal body L-ring protein FlgH [Sulfurospirillum sp.]|nr:flagellar basal body L-ring protein FlgH [Sulfurospirillum sp.]MBL0703093.1 flagellar basal body L-ring protein FlgH [Sulfurospirillum sp.]